MPRVVLRGLETRAVDSLDQLNAPSFLGNRGIDNLHDLLTSYFVECDVYSFTVSESRLKESSSFWHCLKTVFLC